MVKSCEVNMMGSEYGIMEDKEEEICKRFKLGKATFCRLRSLGSCSLLARSVPKISKASTTFG